MRQMLTTIFLLVTLIPSPQYRVSNPATAPTSPEPDSGAVVCPPQVYPVSPGDCVPLGPSEYLTNAAAAGILFPTLPLPAYTPDSALNDLPYQYFRVDEKGTPLFTSLEDLLANQPSGQVIAPGISLYVSYQDRVETDQGVVYQLRTGKWIRGDGARLAKYDPSFQGLLFSSQPRHPFGWVLGAVESRSSPGLNTPKTGHSWYRYNVVQIYATKTVDNLIWDLITPDEWLDARFVGRVDPHTDPPQGVTGDRWIEVNLSEQTLSVYDHDRLIFATLVASGVKPFWTRPGLFHIYEKDVTGPMSGSTAADKSDYYYLEDVPWTMYFDEKRALHGAYWHNGFGYARSHGCVNLSIGDSHWLFDWAKLGDYVYVYDPSGQTPTDPSLFGTGAP